MPVAAARPGEARRLTSTPAIESDPHFSPDGKWIAFTSNRAGVGAVYVMPAEGGEPRRITWSPAGEEARGWSPDGRYVLFSSGRVSAPTTYNKLFMIPMQGGVAKLNGIEKVDDQWLSVGPRSEAVSSFFETHLVQNCIGLVRIILDILREPLRLGKRDGPVYGCPLCGLAQIET